MNAVIDRVNDKSRRRLQYGLRIRLRQRGIPQDGFDQTCWCGQRYEQKKDTKRNAKNLDAGAIK
jgi:hypothetical protein